MLWVPLRVRTCSPAMVNKRKVVTADEGNPSNVIIADAFWSDRQGFGKARTLPKLPGTVRICAPASPRKPPPTSSIKLMIHARFFMIILSTLYYLADSKAPDGKSL